MIGEITYIVVVGIPLLFIFGFVEIRIKKEYK